MNKSLTRKLSLMAASACLPLISFAQKTTGTQLVDNIKTKIETVGKTVINIVNTTLGLAAIIMLIVIVVEAYKPNSQSKDSLIKWFVITIVVFIALELIKNAFF